MWPNISKLGIFVCLIFQLSIAKKNSILSVENNLGPEHDAAVMARYVINNVNWAAFGSISTKDEVKGFPMSNMLGISDGPLDNGKGIPYILMSHDITGKDILENSNISLGVSLAQTGYCQYNSLDQQDPRCARVTFIGHYRNLSTEDPNYTYAKDTLNERHPHLDNWKTFYLGTLDIKFIAVLDWFGGAKIVPVEDYINIKPHEVRERLLVNSNRNSQKGGQFMGKLSDFCLEDTNDQMSEFITKFIIHNADWGTVTTLAYKDDNPNIVDGTPFNSIVSVADGFVSSGSGIPYIYVSPLEFLVKHAQHDNRISMILSLAGTKYCRGLDPINDLCPAVVLTGTLVEVNPDTLEYSYAQMALFSRHASMARLPTNHQFSVSMVQVDYVQLKFRVCDKIEYYPKAWKNIGNAIENWF